MSHWFLNAIALVLPTRLMFVLWFVAGVGLGVATFQIETFFERRRRMGS